MKQADKEWLKELVIYFEKILKIHDELFLLDKVYLKREHAENILTSLKKMVN